MAAVMISPFAGPSGRPAQAGRARFAEPAVAARPAMRPTAVKPSVVAHASNTVRVTGAQLVLRWSMVVAAGAILVLGLNLAMARVVQSLDGPVQSVTARAATANPGEGLRLHTVRPGETFWSLAAELQPTGDPRPLVDRLVRLNGGAGLVAGASIVLPELPPAR